MKTGGYEPPRLSGLDDLLGTVLECDGAPSRPVSMPEGRVVVQPVGRVVRVMGCW